MSALKLSNDAVDLAENELRRSVEKAALLARDLKPEKTDELIGVIRDIWGAAVVCQLQGVSSLMDEIAAVLKSLAGDSRNREKVAAAIRDALQATLGLLDYLVKKRMDNPCLLIPELSALRSLQKKPPYYEYHLLSGENWPRFLLSEKNLANAAPDLALLKRISQFYQMGLLQILKDTDRDKGLEILSEAAGRLTRMSLSPQEKNYWAVFKSVVDSMVDGSLSLRVDRVRLLAVVEKQLRGIANSKPGQAASSVYPEGLWRAFLALVAINPDPVKRNNAKHEFGAPKLDFTDTDLSGIRQQMLGKSDNRRSPFSVLQKTVTSLRAALDLAQEEDQQLPAEVISTISKDFTIAGDHCQMLGLGSIADKFRHHLETLNNLLAQGGNLANEQLLEFTNSVLYLESAVAEFWGNLPTQDELREWDNRPFSTIVQNSQFETARHAVLQGATGALVEIKILLEEIRKNVARSEFMLDLEKSFNSLRGCSVILGMDRFSKLVEESRSIILNRDNLIGEGVKNFDILADMLISLEFYLDACKAGDFDNENSLDIAQECLAVCAARS